MQVLTKIQQRLVDRLAELGPSTAAELAAVVPMQVSGCKSLLRRVRGANGPIYIAAWEVNGSARVPVYAVGAFPDVARPPVMTPTQINRAYMARRHQRRALTGWIQP